MNPGHALQKEGKRHTGGRELRERDAEEDHPAEHEVDPHERTDEPYENASDERVVQEEVRSEHLDEHAHRDLPAATPKASTRRSVDSISAVVPLIAEPSSTQMTERTTSRTRRR